MPAGMTTRYPSQLKPKSDCKLCHGRGTAHSRSTTVAAQHTAVAQRRALLDVNAAAFRRPCVVRVRLCRNEACPPASRLIEPGVETVRVPQSLRKRLAGHLLDEYDATAAAAGDDEAEGAMAAEGAAAAAAPAPKKRRRFNGSTPNARHALRSWYTASFEAPPPHTPPRPCSVTPVDSTSPLPFALTRQSRHMDLPRFPSHGCSARCRRGRQS